MDDFGAFAATPTDGLYASAGRTNPIADVKCTLRHSRVDSGARSTRGLRRPGSPRVPVMFRRDEARKELRCDTTTRPATAARVAGRTRVTAAQQGRIGVAVIGLGGAVATTAVAGVELMRLGSSTTAGLPFAHRDDLVPYESLVFGGWDVDARRPGQGRARAPGARPAQIEARRRAAAADRGRGRPSPTRRAAATRRGDERGRRSAPLRERVAHVARGPAPLPRRARGSTASSWSTWPRPRRWPDLTLGGAADARDVRGGARRRRVRDHAGDALLPTRRSPRAARTSTSRPSFSRRARAARARRARGRPGGRQGRQDRPDDDQDRARAGVPRRAR